VAIKRGNRVANRILAVFLTTLSIPLLTGVAYHTEYILNFPHLIKIDAPLIFVFGPLFFLYVKALTSTGFVLDKRRLLHLVPFAIYTVYLLPFYLQSRPEKINFWTATVHRHELPWQLHLESVLGISHFLVYMVLTAGLLVNHARILKESFASTAKINLRWIRNLMIGLGMIWAFSLVMHAFEAQWMIHLIGLIVVGMIFYMGFKGLTQPEIFSMDEERQPALKYARTALAPEKTEAYLEKLLQVMDAEKPFADGNLSLQKLAKKLAMQSHHLSQIINERLQINFFEFINNYRVEEAKRQLADPAKRHLNIAEIGFEVGFNSLSAFYAVFKNRANMTPAQFRKQVSALRQ
jgi:AraC-like DNA-binding protein